MSELEAKTAIAGSEDLGVGGLQIVVDDDVPEVEPDDVGQPEEETGDEP